MAAVEGAAVDGAPIHGRVQPALSLRVGSSSRWARLADMPCRRERREGDMGGYVLACGISNVLACAIGYALALSLPSLCDRLCVCLRHRLCMPWPMT
jgi:hypothetical protein